MAIRILNKKTVITGTYTISYGNKVTCNVVIKDGNISSFQFMFNHKRYYFIKDIEEVKNTHWSNHYTFMRESEGMFTEETLKKFKDFDKLYYLGAGTDGMVYDINNKPISCLRTIDYITSSIYGKIKTLEQSEKFKKKADKVSWVKDCQVVEIPYYNRNEGESHSVRFDFILPQNKYEKVMEGAEYFSDQQNAKVMKLIFNN